MPYLVECGRRIRENLRDADALFAAAAILGALGLWADAIVFLDALGKVNPRYPGLWRFKARLYRELGDGRMERLCLEAAKREGA